MTFLMPAYKGAGMGEGELGSRIAGAFPDSEVIAVYNGMPKDEAPQTLPSPFRSIWSEAGLRNALKTGYDWFRRCGVPGSVLIRTDSDEHPIDRFQELANQAVEIGGMVVGDLVYSDDLMPRDCLDRLADYGWRYMYGRSTHHRINIGNAHGLQVFASSEICQRVLIAAAPILDGADELNGGLIQWGLDAVLILAAVVADIPLNIVPINGVLTRNRSADKIADQFGKHQLLLEAARQAYPHHIFAVK